MTKMRKTKTRTRKGPAISLFAAHFAAGLLLERGCILKRGDTERWLEWLESEPFDAPADAMWRSLMLVRQTHHAGDRAAS